MDFSMDRDFVKTWAQSDDCLEVLTEVAGEIHDEFNAIAPRRTGNMVNSTRQYPLKTGAGWEVELVVNIYYAAYVEAGTRYMRAQHNLRHSIQAVAGRG